MEPAYLLYENYHYIVAAYGYYKVASTGYDNYQNGRKAYSFCSKTYRRFFPDKIKPEWENLRDSIVNIDVPPDPITTKDIDEEWVDITLKTSYKDSRQKNY